MSSPDSRPKRESLNPPVNTPVELTKVVFDPRLLPEHLNPNTNNGVDVSYDIGDIKALSEMGFYKLGAVALVYTLDEQTEDVLFLVAQHQPSSKNPKPVWSFISETSRYGTKQDGEICVESAMQTAARCITEELALEDATVLHTRQFPWTPSRWPIGSSETETRTILAPVVPILWPPGGLQDFVRDFKPTSEIQQLRLIKARQLPLITEDLRRGFLDCIVQMVQSEIDLSQPRKIPPFFSRDNLLPKPLEEYEPRTMSVPFDVFSLQSVLATLQTQGVDEWEDVILPKLTSKI